MSASGDTPAGFELVLPNRKSVGPYASEAPKPIG